MMTAGIFILDFRRNIEYPRNYSVILRNNIEFEENFQGSQPVVCRALRVFEQTMFIRTVGKRKTLALHRQTNRMGHYILIAVDECQLGSVGDRFDCVDVAKFFHCVSPTTKA